MGVFFIDLTSLIFFPLTVERNFFRCLTFALTVVKLTQMLTYDIETWYIQISPCLLVLWNFSIALPTTSWHCNSNINGHLTSNNHSYKYDIPGHRMTNGVSIALMFKRAKSPMFCPWHCHSVNFWNVRRWTMGWRIFHIFDVSGCRTTNWTSTNLP